MLNARGAVIYVGKAKQLRARLLTYFRSRSRDPKAGRILAHTRAVAWEYVPNEFAALLRELELIQRWRPRFNVQGQPQRRRRTFVCLGRHPAAYVFLTRRPPATALALFGPIPAGERARQAVRRLNDWFQLRDCPQSQAMFFADQPELFPVPRTPGCLRYEIGTCLGPCIGACSRSAYRNRVHAVRAYLAGTDRTPSARLEQAMIDAAARQDYERAALLRDKLETLRWLERQLAWLKQVRQRHSFVYAVRGHDGQDLWYVIRLGQVRAVLAEASSSTAKDTVLGKIRGMDMDREANAGVPTLEDIDEVLLVAAWFRKHPQEWERVITQPDRVSQIPDQAEDRQVC
jgi:excinuclease ABC subunit C